MKFYFRYFFIVLTVFFLMSCQTVTISPKGKTHVYSGYPHFERSYNFFFWGLVGEYSINIEKVCKNRPVKQMQTQQTFLNGFLGVITLGIYSPRTARIWCEKKKKETEI